MRLLLDSHVALWWLADDRALGASCADHIETADEVWFSAVTPWELGIKRSLGKIAYPDGLSATLRSEGFAELAISASHAGRAADLPPHHGDPFDRMLVAQAQLESLVLVSADRSMRPYDVVLLDPLI
ncbi:MAG: type II toxin-antitoxin system VapC family toxin [Ilumatobacteraceae bacterium]|jgi:PIN domain nuclease of toxin-antitoxin system|nr:type II toxin-antitoxin system VapC family toxin [Ilumatobacteraceae bacterium]